MFCAGQQKKRGKRALFSPQGSKISVFFLSHRRVHEKIRRLKSAVCLRNALLESAQFRLQCCETHSLEKVRVCVDSNASGRSAKCVQRSWKLMLLVACALEHKDASLRRLWPRNLVSRTKQPPLTNSKMQESGLGTKFANAVKVRRR